RGRSAGAAAGGANAGPAIGHADALCSGSWQPSLGLVRQDATLQILTYASDGQVQATMAWMTAGQRKTPPKRGFPCRGNGSGGTQKSIPPMPPMPPPGAP